MGTESPVRSWMVLGAGVWTVLVIAVVVVTNVVDGAQFCDVTTVTKPEAVTTERTETVEAPAPEGGAGVAAPVTGSSDKRTTAPATTVETTKCTGLGVGQAALLLVPGLLFFVPALTGLDIAGLFKLSFREVEAKLDEQKQAVEEVAQSVRMVQQTIVSQNINIAVIADAGRQARQGQRDLDESKLVQLGEVGENEGS